ncbi:MAG: M20 family metallopeptidase [Thermodesulfobacteriota bacterium]|nr:MAG: M20 family metallopeptidase [Thermodesulfobacteriota bacterium]
MLKEIKKRVDAKKDRLVKFRRNIHRCPELSGEEKNTAAFVAGVLEDNDIEVMRNIGGHGVVGLLKGGAPGPTIAFRADMDALPMQETGEVEYASEIPGVMHACGHDVHTAALMGAAVVLAELRGRLKGNVKFIFQPSEEKSVTGAKKMIEDGALDDPKPEAIVALHCYPEMEVGTIGHKAGIMTASADKFRIVVKGRSGHASRPHQTVDAVLLSALVISAIHHIVSRRTDPLHHAVISIGTICGGTALNIIADRVEMEGTVRTLDSEARTKIRSFIEETIKGVTEGMGGTYELSYQFGTPPVINDKNVDDFVGGCAADILGNENVLVMDEPKMGAEDFAYFTEKVPGTLFRLGTSNSAEGITALLHNPEFDVDEESLCVGAKILAWTAAKFLMKGLKT